jgi:hypothetical protein
MEEKKRVLEILEKDLDEEVLKRLPEWFRVLRAEYKTRKARSSAD